MKQQLKTVIIDDEQQSHNALKALLDRDHPIVDILGHAYSVQDGLSLLAKFNPDLIFLDIQLPDGLGFDLLEKIGSPDFTIIFITAYDKYALSAIKFGALDYLLKPIDREELQLAIQKAQDQTIKKRSQLQFQLAMEAFQKLQQRELPSRLAISTAEGILYKKVKDIIRLEAQQNYTEFLLSGEPKKVLASVNIGEYEDQFEPYRELMRVHRSHLVNLYFVDKFVKGDGGYLQLQDGSKISVSKMYREDVKKRLEMI